MARTDLTHLLVGENLRDDRKGDHDAGGGIRPTKGKPGPGRGAVTVACVVALALAATAAVYLLG